jgi:hypothetical protein
MPTSPSFSVLVQLIVGPADGPGEESFDLLLCSPAWLEEQEGPVIGWHHLIVRDYNYDHFERFVVRYLERCSADDWTGVACKVGRLGRWEFEDYRE